MYNLVVSIESDFIDAIAVECIMDEAKLCARLPKLVYPQEAATAMKTNIIVTLVYSCYKCVICREVVVQLQIYVVHITTSRSSSDDTTSKYQAPN